ncbi:MAG: PhzF family phenazine biosynthesis protein [Acidobacteriota bacterium]|nr:PhzF family phenazine biosynthesis protein [Acidobacteriota bacterium]
MPVRRRLTGEIATVENKSGELGVDRTLEQGSPLYALDFPARPPHPLESPTGLAEALGAKPREVLEARDLLCVFSSEDEILALKPDFAKIAALDSFAVIVTAPGKDCDFVSRFFAPAKGVNEDPITGSAHCTLIPYWSARLGQTELFAR